MRVLVRLVHIGFGSIPSLVNTTDNRGFVSAVNAFLQKGPDTGLCINVYRLIYCA